MTDRESADQRSGRRVGSLLNPAGLIWWALPAAVVAGVLMWVWLTDGDSTAPEPPPSGQVIAADPGTTVGKWLEAIGRGDGEAARRWEAVGVDRPPRQVVLGAEVKAWNVMETRSGRWSSVTVHLPALDRLASVDVRDVGPEGAFRVTGHNIPLKEPR